MRVKCLDREKGTQKDRGREYFIVQNLIAFEGGKKMGGKKKFWIFK